MASGQNRQYFLNVIAGHLKTLHCYSSDLGNLIFFASLNFRL